MAVIIAAANDGFLFGSQHSSLLLLALGGILGAVTGHLVSGAFRVGLLGGLLLGVFGFQVAVTASSLGAKISAETLCLICVGAGGIIGGLVPAMLYRWRQLSSRIRRCILSVGIGLLILLAWRWRVVSVEARFVEEFEAAGAVVEYWDVNPLPMILDSRRMDSRSEWLRKLLGLRVVRVVTLRKNVGRHYDVQLLVDHLPGLKYLSLSAYHFNDEVLELLNSGKLPRLDALRISGREFDDAWLSRLHPLPGLHFLNLNGTSITDDSIEHLMALPGLKTLDVYKTNISPDGVKRLKVKISNVWDAL